MARWAIAAAMAAAVGCTVSPARHEAAQDPITAQFIAEATGDRGRAFETLQWMTDRIGGRVSCTDSGRQAEDFAFQQLQAFGVPSVAYEPFTMPSWQNLSIEVTMVEPRQRRIYAVCLANTRSTPPDGVTAEVVSLGYGTPAEFEAAGASIQGKFVMVRHGAPEGQPSVHRVEKLTMARAGGAAGMILVHTTSGNVVQAGVCAIGEPSEVPAVSIPLEEGNLILRLLESGQTVRLTIRSQCELGEREARNVVGEIRGSERPEEIVVIGAHLDSWALGQGAVDNGTGSAVVMEAARLFVASGLQPRRTVRFILFMGEELGLYGSKAYVAAHAAELDNVVAMMNLDMVGRPTGIQLYAVDEAVPLFEEFLRQNPELELEGGVGNAAELHSDHQPFMLAGVPAMSLQTDLPADALAHYHGPGDTLERVPADALGPCAATAAAVVWAVANMPERPLTRYSPEVVRERMERDGMRDALIREGQWPFEESDGSDQR